MNATKIISTIIIVFGFVFFNNSIVAQDYNVFLEEYGVINGLPHREVNTVLQCSNGYIWIGTPKGIARFDGYDFKIYDSSTDGFMHDNIWRILEDAHGLFWLLPIPPFEDFNIWNPITRNLEKFSTKYGSQIECPTDHPAKWISTEKEKIILACLDNKSIVYFDSTQVVKKINLDRTIRLDFFKKAYSSRALISADEKAIWGISSDSSIVKFDWEGHLIRKYPHNQRLEFARVMHDNAHPFAFSPWSIYVEAKKAETFYIDRNDEEKRMTGKYLFPSILPDRSIENGIEDLIYDDNCIFNINGEKIACIKEYSKYVHHSLLRSFIYTQDRSFWAGTDFGLKKLHLTKKMFRDYLVDGNEDFDRLAIRGILADSNFIMANVETIGPVTIDLKTNEITTIKLAPEGNYALKRFSDGTIAAGNALDLNLIKNEVVRTYPIGKYIWSIHDFGDEKLWLGTSEGLINFDRNSETSTKFLDYNAFHEIDKAIIYSIIISKDDNYWICSDRGLFKVNRTTGVIAHYSENRTPIFQIEANTIYHIYEDTVKNRLWLATAGNGLIELSLDKGGQVVYQKRHGMEDGLSDETIYAVYADHNHNLWLSSDKGVMRYNPDSGKTLCFLESEGLSNNEFNRISHFQLGTGEIVFGSINGLVSFDPKDFDDYVEDVTSPLQITSYMQYDVESSKMLDKTSSVIRNGEITLNPGDRFFILELALLNYEYVENTVYAYRFQGLETEWNYTDERSLRLGRLPYGRYVLQLKAQDAKGNWTKEPLELSVNVLSPFYSNKWFLGAMGLILFLGILLMYFLRINRLSIRHEKLEELVKTRTEKILKDKEVIERQTQEIRNLEKLKSNFFTNVSHELRTPLNLIISPLERLIKIGNKSKEEEELMDFAYRNSKKLLNLVNEVLDLSKLESGSIPLVKDVFILDKFLTVLISHFSSLEHSSRIKLNYNLLTTSELFLHTDKGKLEKILYNLIGNALKFSPDEGIVKLNVFEKQNEVIFEVEDFGPGINNEDINKVFDRFFQSSQKSLQEKGGYGIGLSIAKQMSELIGGSLTVHNKTLKNDNSTGCIFTLKLKKEQISVNNLEQESGFSEMEILSTDTKNALNTDGKPRILVVEDNRDLSKYLQLILKNYQIVTALNGKLALDILKKNSDFDLILSDLMMPKMDGLELLEIVKSDDRYRHIPFIMLTAKLNKESSFQALRIGVDDYITKPFNEEELLVRIDSLIKNYKSKIKEYVIFNGLVKEQTNQEHPVSQVDIDLLEQIEKIIIDYLDDKLLTVEFIANQIFISERQLYRKIKSLTGLTPNHYIQNIRLHTARELIQIGKYSTLKEIAQKVGYHDVKYFSRLFEKQYGLKPSQLMS